MPLDPSSVTHRIWEVHCEFLSEWTHLCFLIEIFKMSYSTNNSIFKWIIIELVKKKYNSFISTLLCLQTPCVLRKWYVRMYSGNSNEKLLCVLLFCHIPLRVFYTLWPRHTFIIICQRNPFRLPNCTPVHMEPFGQKRTHLVSMDALCVRD